MQCPLWVTSEFRKNGAWPPGSSIRLRSVRALIIWKMNAPKNARPRLSKWPRSMPPSGVRGGMTRSVASGSGVDGVNEPNGLVADGLTGSGSVTLTASSQRAPS